MRTCCFLSLKIETQFLSLSKLMSYTQRVPLYIRRDVGGITAGTESIMD